MIFLSTEPIQTQFLSNRKVIVLTHRQLIFSQTELFENYLSISLMGEQPQRFYFSEEAMEVLVVSKNMLEVYECDCKTYIQIKRIVVMNEKEVNSVTY